MQEVACQLLASGALLGFKHERTQRSCECACIAVNQACHCGQNLARSLGCVEVHAVTDEQGQVGDMMSKAPHCEIIAREAYEP